MEEQVTVVVELARGQFYFLCAIAGGFYHRDSTEQVADTNPKGAI